MMRIAVVASVVAAAVFGGVVWAADGAAAITVSAAPSFGASMVGYLGVTTHQADATLDSHIKLPEGVGVVVDFVAPGSPAFGKLQRFDVLHKLNDQILVNHEQLVVLLRMMKPGTEVVLSVVREAKPMEVKVVLGAKAAETGVREMRTPGAPVNAPAAAWGENPQGLTFNLGALTAGGSATAAGGTAPAQQKVQFQVTGGDASVRNSVIVEGGTVINMTQDAKGGKYLSAKTQDGKVIFEGPVNTDEDRAKVPADIRGKMDRLEANRLEIKFGEEPAEEQEQAAPNKANDL